MKFTAFNCLKEDIFIPKLSFISFRADKWLEITEKAFNFITNLRDVFNSSDFKVKKDILMALGKRITILNGKLNIEFEEWLVPIKEEYKPLEEAYLRLKPEKIDDFVLENEIFEPVRKTWLARVAKFRTNL